MVYSFNTSDSNNLNWEATGALRTLQNVKNLITTWRYEVSYDRTKGLDPSILEKPRDEAIALYISEVYRLVETHEPNATVVSVTPISADAEGNIDLKVVIDID